MTETTKPRIVVGLDNSESSLDALSWAAEQARRYGATLHVVTAWEFPTAAGIPVPIPINYMPASIAREAAEAVIRKTLGDDPDVAVEISVVEGHARTVLVEASHGAMLLVVGRRGRSGVPGLTLGSVSEACARHATCPVVIMHSPDAE